MSMPASLLSLMPVSGATLSSVGLSAPEHDMAPGVNTLQVGMIS